ncbi:MAG: transposase [Candidatus Symbiodolus clandestinus]
MSRQQYTPEFKRRTRELLAENGKSILQVAKELGISENTLWISTYQYLLIIRQNN